MGFISAGRLTCSVARSGRPRAMTSALENYINRILWWPLLAHVRTGEAGAPEARVGIGGRLGLAATAWPWCGG